MKRTACKVLNTQISTCENISPPSVLFMGHRQTVQTQIRHRILRCLIRIFQVCLQNVLLTRNCVYETLRTQPLACPPFCSPDNLFTILLQLTKSEATSCNSFQDIFIGSFRCPNLQRALTKKIKGDNENQDFLKKKKSPGNLLLALYQLSNFEAPSCNGF